MAQCSVSVASDLKRKREELTSAADANPVEESVADSKTPRIMSELDKEALVNDAPLTSLVSKLLGKNNRIDNKTWPYKLARVTDEAQECFKDIDLERLPNDAEPIVIKMEDFVSFLKLKNEASKRPDYVVGTAILANPLSNALYTCLLAAFALVKAHGWLEKQVERLDAAIDKKRESESDEVQEKADELEEVKEELVEILDAVETSGCAAEEMLNALCVNKPSAEDIMSVIDEGCMQLDIGEEE